MRIDRVTLTLAKLPYVHFFETSFGREVDRTFIIVKVEADGILGYGEVVADKNPLYSYETTTTAWHILEEFLVPLVLKENITDPLTFSRRAGRFKGHPMAKAGLELALWDVRAKAEGLPLHAIYGGTQKKIPAGVSIGIQDTVPALLERTGHFLEEGYRRIKIKIKPGWDVSVCAAVREKYPDILFQADANGAYSLKDTVLLKDLDAFDLLMLEQPFPPHDLWDHSRLQKEIRTPLCLDESILSAESARKAYEMESCRIINIKVGRVGGIVEARKIHDFCRDKDIPVWCGGMLESGIGRAHNLHLASLPRFTFPNDLSASRRYYKQDLIEPPIEVDSQGMIDLPRSAGIGVVPQEDRIARSTLKEKTYTRKNI
ncbi:MAG: o-succinylbenzoate synthase [Candidatus Aminicenantes bacterium]|nr:o-succinylbenzoate synthase [Candidatus Aminicenantes bacterium]